MLVAINKLHDKICLKTLHMYYIFITQIITSQSYVGGTNFEVTRVCACLHELLIIGSG